MVVIQKNRKVDQKEIPHTIFKQENKHGRRGPRRSHYIDFGLQKAQP